jgi:hypothetical protein
MPQTNPTAVQRQAVADEHSLAQRTCEIGIRIAPGARRIHV